MDRCGASAENRNRNHIFSLKCMLYTSKAPGTIRFLLPKFVCMYSEGMCEYNRNKSTSMSEFAHSPSGIDECLKKMLGAPGQSDRDCSYCWCCCLRFMGCWRHRHMTDKSTLSLRVHMHSHQHSIASTRSNDQTQYHHRTAGMGWTKKL